MTDDADAGKSSTVESGRRSAAAAGLRARKARERAAVARAARDVHRRHVADHTSGQDSQAPPSPGVL
jgi:hypothetical protein